MPERHSGDARGWDPPRQRRAMDRPRTSTRVSLREGCLAAFKRLLAALRRVDTDTWLNALPPSAVKAASHDTVVDEMLRGIPLPPGFDPSQIPSVGLTKNRYQLGVTVTGTVACSWFQRWAEARGSGDSANVRRAIAALATAKDWPIVREMSRHGGYHRRSRNTPPPCPAGAGTAAPWEHTFVKSQGDPYSRFRRALEHGQPDGHPIGGSRAPQVDLEDALRICFVTRGAEPVAYDRAVLGWLARFVRAQSRPLPHGLAEPVERATQS